VRSRLRRTLALFAFALLAACNGEEDAPPVAQTAHFSVLEDESLSGQLSASDPEGEPISFSLVSTRAGATDLASDGTFTFKPDTDFYGLASFVFAVADDRGNVARATAIVAVENVNDPPHLTAVPELTNSPETEAIHYQLSVIDPDPDEHTFSVSALDPTTVEASVDAQTGLVSLKALRIGVTEIQVSVADAEYADTTAFTFSADEVTKGRILRYSEATSGAVVLRNETDQPVDFVLEHNGFPVFEDLASMAEYVEAMPAQFAGETFGRKLWRFLRDSVYHDVPLNDKRVQYDPWVTLNSLGWGFCSNVAAAYVVIAEAAGYEARVWGLSGHVVPEIRIGGQWQMYDPDLAVYYNTADGRVAGVQELAANPSLITTPIDPLLVGSSYPFQFPYSDTLANFYSTTYDNFDGTDTFLPAHDSPPARIVLPPRATLTYPGRWTDAPVGYDGTTPYDVRAFRQALIELPNGWTGEVVLPWMAWEITGAGGQVGIDGKLFAVGSPELIERLRNTELPVTSLQVYSNSGVRIILLINAVRFDIRSQTRVTIRGLNVWGIRTTADSLAPTLGGGAALESSLLKPLPATVN
jgi:hypothetical protein